MAGESHSLRPKPSGAAQGRVEKTRFGTAFSSRGNVAAQTSPFRVAFGRLFRVCRAAFEGWSK